MADQTVVHIGENSPEYVAYRMARDIITHIDNKKLSQISREEYLKTYWQCWRTVKGIAPEDSL